MKIYKLNQAGISHFLVPALIVAIVALVGVRVMTASHADSNTSNATVALVASTDATSATSKNVAILGAANTPSGTTSSQSSVPYSFIGYQTVNVLGAGQSLSYNDGIKGNVKSCFEVYVQQPKTGTAKVPVEFANNNNTVTKTLSSTDTDNLQQVCVAPGSSSNPGFDVENLSTQQQNVAIEVYQDVLTW